MRASLPANLTLPLTIIAAFSRLAASRMSYWPSASAT
jgi:hypothetical protein